MMRCTTRAQDPGTLTDSMTRRNGLKNRAAGPSASRCRPRAQHVQVGGGEFGLKLASVVVLVGDQDLAGPPPPCTLHRRTAALRRTLWRSVRPIRLLPTGTTIQPQHDHAEIDALCAKFAKPSEHGQFSAINEPRPACGNPGAADLPRDLGPTFDQLYKIEVELIDLAGQGRDMVSRGLVIRQLTYGCCD
jgi:hypothetical protein